MKIIEDVIEIDRVEDQMKIKNKEGLRERMEETTGSTCISANRTSLPTTIST